MVSDNIKVVDTVDPFKSDCDQSNGYNTTISCISEGINLSTSANRNVATAPEAVALQPAPSAIQPMVSPEKYELLKKKFCPGCTNDEFELFVYNANTYRLDPFLRQIWAVKYTNQPAQIFCGRDGYLAIAHRSGVFDGIESHGNYDPTNPNKLISATATVWRRDCSHQFQVTVRLSEYSTGRSVWASKPETMLCKVAECQCLRKAFSISGLYDPSEMDRVNNTHEGVNQVDYVDVEDVKPQLVAPAETPTAAPTTTPKKVRRSNVPLF